MQESDDMVISPTTATVSQTMWSFLTAGDGTWVSICAASERTHMNLKGDRCRAPYSDVI